MINSQGMARTKTITAYMHRGTVNPITMWYSGIQNQTVFSNANPALNQLRCYPIVLSRQCLLSKISFEVTTGGTAGSVGRCGIYRCTSIGNMYPSSLVVDSGEFDCTSIAVKTTGSLSVVLSAGIYFLATNFSVAAPNCRLVSSAAHPFHIWGALNTLVTLPDLMFVALAYGALPSSFPAGGGLASSNCIEVALEFA
jgi:hypothetical protein